jgi:hypothetical protein
MSRFLRTCNRSYPQHPLVRIGRSDCDHFAPRIPVHSASFPFGIS